MAVELMSVSAYARHRGCDEKAVRKAINEERITAIEREGKKLIDPAVADIQWERNTRARVAKKAHATDAAPPAAGRDDGPPAGDADYMSYQAARAMRENEEAMKARLERLELEKKLTSAEDVGRAIWTAFRLLRDSAMPLGRRLGGQLAAMTDAREIQLRIDEEMRNVLTAFRDKLLTGLADQHGAGARPDDVADMEEGAHAGS